MGTNRWKKGCQSKESGQVMVLILLAMGLFLLGAAAFSVDMANLWFHRQSAQNARGCCMYGRCDGHIGQSLRGSQSPGVYIGSPFDCKDSANVPCKYAAFNGYDGQTPPGTRFPSRFRRTAQVKGVPSPSVPDTTFVPNAFMRVDVLDHVQTYFLGLLTGTRTQDVRSFAVCATVLATSPIPIVVLHPTQSSSSDRSMDPKA